MSGRYAEGTTVPVDKSQQEITRLFNRYRIETYAFGQDRGVASVAFEMSGMPITVRIKLPERPPAGAVRIAGNGRRVSLDVDWEQGVREAWRALVLLLKANLEAVERSIVTVEQAFMAFLRLPNGDTLGDRVLPQYAMQREQFALDA